MKIWKKNIQIKLLQKNNPLKKIKCTVHKARNLSKSSKKVGDLNPKINKLEWRMLKINKIKKNKNRNKKKFKWFQRICT